MISNYENASKMYRMMKKCVYLYGDSNDKVKSLRKEVNDTMYILRNIKNAETEKTKAFETMCRIVIVDCQRIMEIIDKDMKESDNFMGIYHISILCELLE